METSLIAHFKPKSPISEAYRMIRTNIRFASINQQIKTILLTSAGPSEGKTTTACNLAVVFAQAGNKTLIVDADLRKPRINEIFSIDNEFGLANLLLGEKEDYKELIIKTDIENLDIMTTGETPPNPSEMLGSEKMKKFMQQIREDYDMVIIDSPPAGLVTDAAVLSSITDGVIFVVAFGKADAVSTSRAKDSLVSIGANVMGVVLNKVERRGGSYYGYYYYSKDGYYGDNGYYGSSGSKKK